MSSLDELEAFLLKIDEAYDANSQLQHVSFEKTQNKSLGYTDLSDFTVSMPWKEWKDHLEPPKTFPSPLQEAFKDVLNRGKSTEECFIDIATMNAPGPNFFGQGDHDSKDEKLKSLSKAIADAIEAVNGKDAKIIIRFLSGTNEVLNFDNYKLPLENIFWPGPLKKPLVNGKTNAVLYLGYYSPVYKIK
jgi:hypothetical protein